MATHKCFDCGFLALRNATTREVCEIERDPVRTFGWQPSRRGEHGTEYVYEVYALCTKNVRLFRETPIYGALMGPADQHFAFAEAIQEPIECDRFTQWIEGWSPREHQEMIDHSLLKKIEDEKEKDRRDFEAGLMNQARQPQWLIAAIAALALIVSVIIALHGQGAPRTVNNFYVATPVASATHLPTPSSPH